MMAKIAPSRRRTFSIMAHSHWENLVIYEGGKKVVIPQKYITKEGQVYKRVNKLLVEKNIERLQELGVAVI